MHGFKCAGTSLGTIIAANFPREFRCIESADRHSRLEWSRVISAKSSSELVAISSHTLEPPQGRSSALVVGLVRRPRDRLISAWLFYRKQSRQPDLTFQKYLERQKRLKNFQCQFYSHQLKNSPMFKKGWQNNACFIQFDFNFFLGTVERFAESLTIIEFLIQQRGFNFKGVNIKENVNNQTEDTDSVEIPPDYIHLDELLYERCNQMIDTFKLMVPNFDARLLDLQQRCPSEVVNDDAKSLVSPESFVFLSP